MDFISLANFCAILHLWGVIPSQEASDQRPPYMSKQVETARVFFVEEEVDAGFHVRCGGLERCRPDYEIDRPEFPWFLLEFVQGGKGRVVLNGVETPLKPGVFFLYGPGVKHRIETDPAKPLVKYFAGFGGSEAAAFLDQYHLRPGMVMQCLRAEPMRRAFDLLIERGARQSEYSAVLCEVLMKQLLLMGREDAVEAGITETRAFGTFVRVREYIEENYLGLGSLEAVATACELDAPYLCRLFARFHDESPYQFLTRLRMQHAAMLLLDQGMSVKDAAKATGFPDPFHFSRVFKSVHRVPPSRYAEAMRDKQPR